MDARTILEFFGWLSAALVILSLMLSDQRRFRWWNLAGSLLAVGYNAALGIWPVVATNAVIAAIDVYWIRRLASENSSTALSEKTSLAPSV